MTLLSGHATSENIRKQSGSSIEIPFVSYVKRSEETGEIAKHIIIECERLDARRRAIFGPLQPGDDSETPQLH